MADSGIVPLRPLDTRIEPCVMCGKNVRFESCTAPDEECPEMARFPEGTWIGIMNGPEGITIAICCSEDCMRALVR